MSARLAVLDSFPVPGLVIPQGNTLPSMAAPSVVPFGGPTLEQFPMTGVPEKFVPTDDRDAYRHCLQRAANARCELEELRIVALERINQIEQRLAEIDRDLALRTPHPGLGLSDAPRKDPANRSSAPLTEPRVRAGTS